MTTNDPPGLTRTAAIVKRSFDLLIASIGLLLLGWLIAAAWILARIDTGRGFFLQERIGLGGRPFNIVKISTMRPSADVCTNVTVYGDPRITRLGCVLRAIKVDELPQLYNVLVGHMSIVGPRPDVAGYADTLDGSDRIVLAVRPGITGPATLRFRNEERLLRQQPDPERYNREVLFPEKVRLNREYVETYRFRDDIRYVIATLLNRRV